MTPIAERKFHAQLLRAIEQTDGKEIKLYRIAQALVKQAIAGDVTAIKEVADRIDGKVPQPIAPPAGDTGPTMLVVRWGEPRQHTANDDELPLLELKANNT